MNRPGTTFFLDGFSMSCPFAGGLEDQAPIFICPSDGDPRCAALVEEIAARSGAVGREGPR